MLEDAADVVAGHVRELGVSGLVKEQRFAALPDRRVNMHARAVVSEDRLRHESGRLAVLPGDVLDDVLKLHDIVSAARQGVETPIDLGLTCCAHLMVGALDLHAKALHDGDDFVTQITKMVGRGDRKISALVFHLVSAVAAILGTSSVPRSSLGVDGVVRGVLTGVEANVVEDVKLSFRSEEGSIADPSRCEVSLGLTRDVARIAAVGLLRNGVMDVEIHDKGFALAEGVDPGGRRIG